MQVLGNYQLTVFYGTLLQPPNPRLKLHETRAGPELYSLLKLLFQFLISITVSSTTSLSLIILDGTCINAAVIVPRQVSLPIKLLPSDIS